jgi:hypothetical protein
MALAPSDARTASRQSRKTTPRSEPPKRKRRPGRPSKYKPEFAEQVTNYCLLGASNQELGRLFGVDERTINRWLVTKPEFCQAIKKGRDIADANVSKALYRRAIGWTQPAVKIVADAKTGAEHVVHYEEQFPPDTAAAFIWLKNRRPDLWRDRKEVSGTSKVKVDGRARYELSPKARQLLEENMAELGKGSATSERTTGNGAAANGATKN